MSVFISNIYFFFFWFDASSSVLSIIIGSVCISNYFTIRSSMRRCGSWHIHAAFFVSILVHGNYFIVSINYQVDKVDSRLVCFISYFWLTVSRGHDVWSTFCLHLAPERESSILFHLGWYTYIFCLQAPPLSVHHSLIIYILSV